MKRTFFLSSIALVAFISLGGGIPSSQRKTLPPFLEHPSLWADSVLASLTMEQRIAQLMMVAAYSNKDAKHVNEVESLVTKYGIGGLIFFQGGPVRQARLVNRYQALARTPIIIGMDLEWGLSMRLDSTIRFPRQMTLGATEDVEGIELLGEEIARQMKRLGVQVSFSPDVDVNVNPANPVINDRSFGENPAMVARLGTAYMDGLQRGGVLAVAKHFPGHGDTDQDSHKTLPKVSASAARLDSVELAPFRKLVGDGVGGVMVAHLEVPALDSTPGLPSTMSKPIVTGLLQDEMGFKGLVFTDALNMKGIANADKPGEIELRALLAGNDILLFPQDPVKAIKRIKQAVDSGQVSAELINAKCLKVLRAKDWAGLDRFTPIKTAHLSEDLNTANALALRRRLYAEALTVVRNDGVLPIEGLDTLRIASLVIGDSVRSTFPKHLARYANITEVHCPKILNPAQSQAMLDSLKKFNLVIASVHNTSFRLNKEFGVPQLTLDFLRRVGNQQRMVFVLFANPYRLGMAYGAQRWNGLVVAYEETDDTQDLAAQLIFGAMPAAGRLPVTASSYFPAGMGVERSQVVRLRYDLPEQDTLETGQLMQIDTIVNEGLAEHAYPGCQVLVARHGAVIWNKAYGSPTYAGMRAVTTDDIFDLASISKVAGTTLALMKLVDEGKVDVEKTLGNYIPKLVEGHPYHASLKLSEILAHQAGLKPFVPFYLRLLSKGQLKPELVTGTADASHDMRMADSLYISSTYRDSLVQWVLETPTTPRGKYVYSDMGMYLLMRVVEEVSGMPFDRYLQTNYYAPLGLSTMGYQPWKRFPLDRIMPTENDQTFRHRQVRGDVHDPGAAMMGGVAGHAGLFSNANDLAVIMQMLLNGGTYGGKRYLQEKTISTFTSCRFCTGHAHTDNRRGLGWDRPQARGTPGPASVNASQLSYGHTGFTGTMVWADPATGTVFVFLSNRVYPEVGGNKLAKLNIRTRIQQVVEALAPVPGEGMVPASLIESLGSAAPEALGTALPGPVH